MIGTEVTGQRNVHTCTEHDSCYNGSSWSRTGEYGPDGSGSGRRHVAVCSKDGHDPSNLIKHPSLTKSGAISF